MKKNRILNRNLTKDETRRQKAMKVLNVMLSEDAQNRIVYDGQDILSYSQDVDTHLTEYLKDVRPVIEENHMYIRIASNDFFNVSQDVVSKMISGKYDAKQAYQSFNTKLLKKKSDSEKIVLDSKKAYSNLLIVSIDAEGNNWFEQQKVEFNKRKDAATEEICKQVGFIK